MDNIDIEWFFKVPGLFITGGVFLILIAIIVYIVGNSKAKKASQDDTNYTVDVDSVKDNTTNSNVVAPLVNPTVKCTTGMPFIVPVSLPWPPASGAKIVRSSVTIFPFTAVTAAVLSFRY